MVPEERAGRDLGDRQLPPGDVRDAAGVRSEGKVSADLLSEVCGGSKKRMSEEFMAGFALGVALVLLYGRIKNWIWWDQ